MASARRFDPAGVIAAVLLLGLAGLIVWDLRRLEASPVYGIGPAAMPIVVASGLGLLAAGNLVLGLRGAFPPRERGEATPLLLTAGGFAALVALIGFGLGFIPATAILFWSTASAFGRRAPVADLGLGLLLGTAAYLLFARALGLALPAGPLERLIG